MLDWGHLLPVPWVCPVHVPQACLCLKTLPCILDSQLVLLLGGAGTTQDSQGKVCVLGGDEANTPKTMVAPTVTGDGHSEGVRAEHS